MKKYDPLVLNKFYKIATKTLENIIKSENIDFKKYNRAEKILENDNCFLIKKPFYFLSNENEIYLYDIFCKNLKRKIYTNIYSYKLSKFIFNYIKDKIVLKNSEIDFLLYLDYKCFSLYKDILLINFKIKEEKNAFKKNVYEARYEHFFISYENYRNQLFNYLKQII